MKKWYVVTIAILAVALTGVIAAVACFKDADVYSEGGVSGDGVSISGDTTAESEALEGEGTGIGAASAYQIGRLNTGNLSETGNGYEGVEGTGDYNYGEALQKSLLFYELQRSGDLPDEVRCNWRGDSCLNDGADNGVDLTGGWFDAGDNVKFNLPMAYSAAVLGWSVYVDRDAYEESGMLDYALGNIKWANDYFIKCHPEDDIYYYQVGNGSQDHTYWGAAETVEYRMDRPSYFVTKDNPGSTVTAEAAASLAICAVVYSDIDAEYSDLCLTHAKSLYDFSRSTLSDSGYVEANGFYDSWSGFYDELAWSGAWLYLATQDEKYLNNAKEDYDLAVQDYDWAMCWDDVHIGAAEMLGEITGDKKYADIVEQHLDWWTTGLPSGERITYTPKGLAWLDNWGSLRYATTTAFVAAIYSRSDMCSDEKADTYWDFAESQIGYALGDTGRSFEIGFGEDYPVHPHHRTAQGSYCDNMNEPGTSRHTLYGALVGGPDASDNYTDEVSNYNNNEVACDYNAGFTGALAAMYGRYHGKTLVDFGAVESIPGNEIFAEGGINVDGEDFIELRVFICNESAWPARVPDNLEFRYYMDLSEVYDAGQTVDNIEVTTNYMQAGGATGLVCQDEDNHIYYLSVDFSDDMIYPGGQDRYRKEIQVRIRNNGGAWDNSNDPSFYNMTNGGCDLLEKTALFEDGKLIFGEEPLAGSGAGESVMPVTDENAPETDTGGNTNAGNNGGNNQTHNNTTVTGGSATMDNIYVDVDYSNMQAVTSGINATMNITNNTGKTIPLENLEIRFYFTNEEGKTLVFSCYHAAVNGKGGNYTGVSGCSGEYESCNTNEENADTLCNISFTDGINLGNGDMLTVNFCINHSDWSEMNTSNDYSVEKADNICIYSGGKLIFGTEPGK